MYTIGLTGGIASGKSTVSAWLREAGLPVVDADLVAREVVEPGTPTLEKLKLAFGPAIIVNGELDRAALGKIAFGSQAELDRLNAIMQPAIQSAMQDKISFWRMQKTPLLILDIPLLFERDYQHQVDEVVVVNATREQQFTRLKARNQLSDKAANARIDAQMPLAEKVALADVVLDNTRDKADLRTQVEQLIQKWQTIAHN